MKLRRTDMIDHFSSQAQLFQLNWHQLHFFTREGWTGGGSSRGRAPRTTSRTTLRRRSELGRPPGSRKSLAAEQTPERSAAAEWTPKRGRGRPPGCRKSLTAELTPQNSNAAEQTPAKTPKAVNFLDLEENEGATPQSYFGVKEGSGVGKRLANRIADIGIVEEQELRGAIAKLSPKHEKKEVALLESYHTFYHKWYFQLRSNICYLFGTVSV